MLPAALRAARFAVVDVETTGASALYDRITEIAVVLVEDGRIVEVIETLIQPGVAIPAFITRLTGIDDRLVAGQPRFEELAPVLLNALEGRVLVGHNVNFDYAFLRQSFVRAGRRFEAPERLCTARLARRLLPGLRSYRLEAVLEPLGLVCQQRHRARGDAEATAALLLRLLELAAAAGAGDLEGLLAFQHRPIAGRPRRGVDEAVIAALPTGPGVYLLKDAQGQVVYVGKSRHVRDRVREHLRGGSADQPRLRRRLRQIVDVEAIETGSELEALFLESKLIKRYLPEANVLGRGWRDYPFLRIDLRDPFPRLEMTREPADDGGVLFGPLRGAARVAAVAELLQDTLGLRRCTGDIRPGMGACPLLDLRKCLGPCVRPEARAAYDQAVQQVLDLLEGRDDALLSLLAKRRDALAEALRFEEAAELRDRLRDLEAMLGERRRLEAVARRNLVVVAPSSRAGHRELFFIRGGRLVEQQRVRLPARADALRRALCTCFVNALPSGRIERETVDEMRQLETWLRRERAVLRCVAVDPAAPEAALPTLLAALRASGEADRSPKPDAPPRDVHPSPQPLPEAGRGVLPLPSQGRGLGG